MKSLRSIFTVLLLATLALAPALPLDAATITSLQASTTQTAGFDGSVVDVSGLSGDFTVKIQVSSLTAGKTARLALEDAAAATFPASPTPANTAWVIQVKGQIGSAYDRVFSIHSRDLPHSAASVFGQTNGKFRISLIGIDSGASITYSAWLEQ